MQVSQKFPLEVVVFFGNKRTQPSPHPKKCLAFAQERGCMSSSTDGLKRRPGGSLVKTLGGVWALLSILPVFSKMLGADFLPSVEWLAKSSVVGIVAGLLTGAMLFLLIIKSIDTQPGSDFKKACAIIISPFIGYVMGRNTVVILGPMILGLVVGHQVELPFTVSNAHHSGSRGCRSPVELESLPLLFDRLCRVPDDLRRSLGPGRKVGVTGRGTNFGVFGKRFHPVD
jgi:hypothetical protein